MSFADMLGQGGIVVWVLIGYSTVGLAIVAERLLLFMRMRKLPSDLWQRLPTLLMRPEDHQDIRIYHGPEARIIEGLLEAGRNKVVDLHSVGYRIRNKELQRMEFGLRTLGILGNTAPLLGLLGTITGMIKAFMVIENAGGRVDAQALAGGIWEAMITTGVGLAVAIPLLILLHFLEGIVDRRNHSMDSTISLILERQCVSQSHTGETSDPPMWDEVTDGI